MPDSVKGFTDITKKLLGLLYHGLLLRRRYGMYVVVGTWLCLLGQTPAANEFRYDLL